MPGQESKRGQSEFPLRKRGLGGFRFSLSRFGFQIVDNLGDDAIDVAEHVEIRKPEHVKAHLRKRACRYYQSQIRAQARCTSAR